MNPAYGDDERAHLLADAEPRLVVVDPGRAPVAGPGPASAAMSVLTLDASGEGSLAALARDQPDAFVDVVVTAADPAALLYTSGTTGRPKGALLSHGNLASNAATLVAAWGFSADDRLLHILPLFHAHGLFVAAHCVLASGSSLTLEPRFDAAATIAALEGATVLMGVPTHYARLLDAGIDRTSCRTVRLFVSGSAPLSAAVHEAFRARTGHTILERYGMTETVMIASNPLVGDRRPGTVGRPLPGVGVRIGAGAVDGVGPVEVHGPNVFAGYWRRPDLATTEFTPDGWFRTGDLGRFDEDDYLHLVGRSKDLVITGGLNVYPKEVEGVLDALPGVAESAVIGVPDDDFGELVVAVVVACDGAALDPSALRRAARERLAAFKVPKQIHVAPSLPRNAMGKVEKATLRQRFAGPADDLAVGAGPDR